MNEEIRNRFRNTKKRSKKLKRYQRNEKNGFVFFCCVYLYTKRGFYKVILKKKEIFIKWVNYGIRESLGLI